MGKDKKEEKVSLKRYFFPKENKTFKAETQIEAEKMLKASK